MSNRPLRVGFAGTPPFAANHLTYLLQHGVTVTVVLTPPDKRAGRGKTLQPSAVKAAAIAANIPVLQPLTLRDPEIQAELAALDLDVLVVVAYGLLLPQAVLDIPRLGCINVHGSLLPRWRGAAPIQRAIEAGDTETGICIMLMDAGLDTGPILATRRCPITPSTTAADLFQTLEGLGQVALLETLNELESLRPLAVPQNSDGATYAPKLSKEEAFISFQLPAEQENRKIRAFFPAPIAYTSLNGDRVRLLQADVIELQHDQHPGTIIAANSDGILIACASNALNLRQVQLPGGKPLPVSALIHASNSPFTPGQILGKPLQ